MKSVLHVHRGSAQIQGMESLVGERPNLKKISLGSFFCLEGSFACFVFSLPSSFLS